MNSKLTSAKVFTIAGVALLITAIVLISQGQLFSAITWAIAAILFLAGAYVKYKSYKDRGDNLPKY